MNEIKFYWTSFKFPSLRHGLWLQSHFDLRSIHTTAKTWWGERNEGNRAALGERRGKRFSLGQFHTPGLNMNLWTFLESPRHGRRVKGEGKKMKEGEKNPNFFLCNYNFHKQEYTKLQHWLIKESWGKCLTRSDTEIYVSYLITFVILEACPFLPILISSLNTFLYIGTRSLCMFELICVSHINVNNASGHLIQQHHTIKFPISKKQKRGCH